MFKLYVQKGSSEQEELSIGNLSAFPALDDCSKANKEVSSLSKFTWSCWLLQRQDFQKKKRMGVQGPVAATQKSERNWVRLEIVKFKLYKFSKCSNRKYICKIFKELLIREELLLCLYWNTHYMASKRVFVVLSYLHHPKTQKLLRK